MLQNAVIQEKSLNVALSRPHRKTVQGTCAVKFLHCKQENSVGNMSVLHGFTNFRKDEDVGDKLQLLQEDIVDAVRDRTATVKLKKD